MKNLTFLIAGVLAVTTLGCRCGGGGPSSTKPDIVANPTALSFSACPTKDEGGNRVDGVFPDLKKLKLTNQGKVSTPLTYTLSGPGAQFFALGGDAGTPMSIDSLGEVEFPVLFSPNAKGDVRADLTIDDQTDGTDNPVVTLLGTGVNLPSQPLIETHPQKQDKTGFLTCTADTPISECTLEFPDTLLDQTNTLQLKIKNMGCPTLKVTDIKIDGQSNPGTNDGFELQSPSTPPTSANPFVLSTIDGTDETVITFKFTATDDMSGATEQLHVAVLTLLSNDPLNGDGFANPARLTLQAKAVKPAFTVSPTNCNFADPNALCGFATHTPHKAKFNVTNEGGTALTISSVKFRSSGTATSSNNRFTVSTNIQGMNIPAFQSAAIEVTETDMPLLVSDQLEIVADIAGNGAGSGGTALVSVISGIKPCMTTDPLDTILFENQVDELGAKVVRIKNGANCGTLLINSINVSNVSGTFFSLVDPIVPTPTQIPAGGQVEATVQYQRPAMGGTQLGTMIIDNNDTDAPQRQLQIVATSMFDPAPVATITACQPANLVNDPECSMGSENSASFNLGMINPDEITFSGAKTTDNGTVASYQFTMLGGSTGGITPAALANNGMWITTKTTKLTIPAGVTNATFRIALIAKDDRGSQSPSPSIITVNIFP